MGLSLTSTAAPHLALGALDAACRARGLDGVELVVSASDDAEALARQAIASASRVTALRTESLDPIAAPALARAAAQLRVPVSVPGDSLDLAELTACARVFQREQARLLLSHRTQVTDVLALLQLLGEADAGETLGLAWEVRPSTEELADAGAVLFAARAHLHLVRLYGGGPEQHDQDGRGVGPLLVDLALSRYSGPIVLCPSVDMELPRWKEWLGSRKSAGCGTRVGPRLLSVDVRQVEPKDRLETILGAYRSLERGATMTLTVDHDPSCMYFMLEATEPAGSFAFRKTADGPEVWRAEVTRT
jgi:uncharacterized protein (DUF2249 family)